MIDIGAIFWDVTIVVIALVLVVIGGITVRDSIGLFRDLLALVITRTSNISQVRDGAVEISGTAKVAEETVQDPITGNETVAYEYDVTEERTVKDDILDWTKYNYRHCAVDDVAVPFIVEDHTGTIRVEPGEVNDAEKYASGKANLYATGRQKEHVINGDRPEEIQQFLDENSIEEPNDGVSGKPLSRMYKTATIEPGDEVYVLGTAEFNNGDRVIHGGDGRFIISSASQARTFSYNMFWAVFKLFGGAGSLIGGLWLIYVIITGIF